MMFSMSRDGALPFSNVLGRVNEITGTPIAPAVLTGVLSALLLLVNVGKAALFTDLTSACIVTLYAAYLFVTVPQLITRLRKRGLGGNSDGQAFDLGRFGLPINVAAVAYGVLMTVDMAWPRASVYDPAGQGWYLQWFSVLLLLGTALTGGATYAYLRRTRRIAPLVAELAPASA
jgi:amino acid transporter